MLNEAMLLAQNKQLREENEELRETLRQLREHVAPMPDWMPRLTPFEDTIVRAMMTGRIVSRSYLIALLYDGREPAWANTVDVLMHRIRRKLNPLGLHIVNRTGSGWYFDAAALDRLVPARLAA